MASLVTIPRTRAIPWVASAGLCLFLLAWVVLASRTPKVEIASTHPYWIVRLTGVTGDVARVWIWSPGATLLTNLSLPAELRLNRHELLVQARSENHRALALQLCDTNWNVSKTLGFVEGERGSLMAFSSVGRAPFVPCGEFIMEKLPEAEPLGRRPVYKARWSLECIRFDPMPVPPVPK